MNMKIVRVGGLALAALVSLAACGTSEKDRVGGGAAAGAATGAGVGALAGPVGVAAGALIGGGAGALTGYTTAPSDVNLGKPVWNNPEVRTPVDQERRGTTRGSAASPAAAPSRPTTPASAAAPGPTDPAPRAAP